MSKLNVLEGGTTSKKRFGWDFFFILVNADGKNFLSCLDSSLLESWWPDCGVLYIYKKFESAKLHRIHII